MCGGAAAAPRAWRNRLLRLPRRELRSSSHGSVQVRVCILKQGCDDVILTITYYRHFGRASLHDDSQLVSHTSGAQQPRIAFNLYPEHTSGSSVVKQGSVLVSAGPGSR